MLNLFRRNVTHETKGSAPHFLTTFGENGEWVMERGPDELIFKVDHADLKGLNIRDYLISKGVAQKYFDVPAGVMPCDRYGSPIIVGARLVFLDWLNPDRWVWKLYRDGQRQARHTDGTPAFQDGEPLMEIAKLQVAEFPAKNTLREAIELAKEKIRGAV